MSFPSGVLRWTGNWSATTEYRYGDIALASTNVSYACGVPTSLNVDPATQPSTDWFGFPSSGGGGSPSTWSQFPATQDVVMGSRYILNAEGSNVNSITMDIGNDMYIQAIKTSQSSIYLQPNSNGSVVVGLANPASPFNASLQVNQIQNLDSNFGTAGQVLSSDGTKIQWVNAVANPVKTIPILLPSYDISGGAELTIWTTDPFTPTVTGFTTVNLSVTASSSSEVSPRLLLELSYIENSNVNYAGSVTFIRPAGVVNPYEGFSGSFTTAFAATAGTSYTIRLQGTCLVDPVIANPWKLVTSTGYIQTNFPPTV